MLDQPQELPPFETAGAAILRYRWPETDFDFGYPLELSSSLYRAADLLPMLAEVDFQNPNTLEAVISEEASRFRQSHPVLLCPEQSLAFCIPANKVQRVGPSRAGQRADYSPEALARRFAEGQRIDIATLDGFTPHACHQEVELQFVALANRVPLVSVIIPSYRQACFLREAVVSVLAQTLGDWEIIIVNDGSPDDTSRVAREVIAQYPEQAIRLLEKSNGGLAHARNAGIGVARGACILPLDADDQIEPTMLEKSVRLLEANPDIAIAYSDVVHFGAANQTIQAAEYDPVLIGANNQLNYCSLFRREVWEETGGYNSNMIWGYEDWDFWVSCAGKGFQARRLPEPLLRYRVKQTSMYTQAVRHDRELRAQIVVNHPELYEVESLQQARVILAGAPFILPPGAPKVSVIVPTFNRPGMLQEAVQSILNQTCRDFEIIVVNDCGLDVREIVAPLAPPGQIVCLRHARNKDRAAARNSGFRVARGKYIAYLDDDDVFLPDHLETLTGFAESRRCKVVYSDAYRAVQRREGPHYQIIARDVPYSQDFDYERILVNNLMPTLCVLHERACVGPTGFFDESLTTHEDWDYWIRMSRLFHFTHLKKVTCEFRWREDGSTTTSARRADFLRTARIVYEKHKAYAAGRPGVLANQRLVLKTLRKELDRLAGGDRKAGKSSVWRERLQKAFGRVLSRKSWFGKLVNRRLRGVADSSKNRTPTPNKPMSCMKMAFPPEEGAPRTPALAGTGAA